MQILSFRHVPFEHMGLIENSLVRQGIGFRYVDLYREAGPCPRVEDADGFVFMGGPMSVNDDLPFIRQETRLISEAVQAGKPVLGICLGAQLIAKALGAKVYRNGAKEIGWFDISLTSAATTDPLFACFRPIETVFHWHGETFDVPPGGEHLASSALCRNQAFRVGENVYGLQFHLEVTPGMIADWCGQDANSGDMRELSAFPDPSLHSSRLAELAGGFFEGWCGLLAGNRELRA